MPWKHELLTLKPGKAWTDTAGRLHSALWMRYSDQTKARYNIIWEEPPASAAPFDNRFYWGRDLDGTLIPRSLTDINEVDDNNNPVLDEDGNQVITLGLKSIHKAKTKETAGSLLSPTDWHVVKAAEVSGYTVPSTITTYRAAVRTASNTIETAIDNAADLDAFIALFDVPVDADGNPTGNAPINDWPDEI
jgi:hypothetical protein